MATDAEFLSEALRKAITEVSTAADWEPEVFLKLVQELHAVVKEGAGLEGDLMKLRDRVSALELTLNSSLMPTTSLGAKLGTRLG